MDKETFQRIKLILDELNLKQEDRRVVMPARERSAELKKACGNNEACPVVALELPDGTILTGKNSETMEATAAVIINAIKHLASIADDMHLISPVILEPIIKLKSKDLGSRNTALSCEEVLIALSICAATNTMAEAALSKLSMLKGCQAHSTAILGRSDEETFRRLDIDVTSDPEYPTNNLYYSM